MCIDERDTTSDGLQPTSDGPKYIYIHTYTVTAYYVIASTALLHKAVTRLPIVTPLPFSCLVVETLSMKRIRLSLQVVELRFLWKRKREGRRSWRKRRTDLWKSSTSWVLAAGRVHSCPCFRVAVSLSCSFKDIEQSEE